LNSEFISLFTIQGLTPIFEVNKMTSTAASVASIEDELDKKREQLNAVLRDLRQATKHLDAFKALMVIRAY
jgi:hypothetical protein